MRQFKFYTKTRGLEALALSLQWSSLVCVRRVKLMKLSEYGECFLSKEEKALVVMIVFWFSWVEFELWIVKRVKLKTFIMDSALKGVQHIFSGLLFILSCSNLASDYLHNLVPLNVCGKKSGHFYGQRVFGEIFKPLPTSRKQGKLQNSSTKINFSNRHSYCAFQWHTESKIQSSNDKYIFCYHHSNVWRLLPDSD